MDYKISICMSSIRPHLWQEIINSIKGNKYPIEIVFVGDVKPDFELPDNVQYHYATVKPAQCYAISFFRAKGELILWSADDGVYDYQQPNNLDILYDFYKNLNTVNAVVGVRPIEDNRDVFRNHYFFGKQAWSPYMLPFGAMDRQLFYEIGGYDNQFIAGQSENDVVMRMYERKARVELCMNSFIFVQHVQKHDWKRSNSVGFRHKYPYDRERLEECWVKEGKNYYKKFKKGTILKNRKCPVESYIDREDIYTINQGRQLEPWVN